MWRGCVRGCKCVLCKIYIHAQKIMICLKFEDKTYSTLSCGGVCIYI